METESTDGLQKGARMTENTIGPIAINDATIEAVNEKVINC